jgi:hypothetical protein
LLTIQASMSTDHLYWVTSVGADPNDGARLS